MQAFTLQHPPVANIQRLLYLAINLGIASIITFSLFVLMQKLIETKHQNVAPLLTMVFEDPVFNRQDSDLIKNTLLPEPKPQVQPEALPKESIVDQEPGAEFHQWTGPQAPVISINNNVMPGLQNTSGRPIVRMEPKYPITAARNGIEGWVKLSFDISTQGKVENIRVLAAEPKRTFNQAAKRALSRWKYQSTVIDGKAVAQPGQTIMLSFNLNQ